MSAPVKLSKCKRCLLLRRTSWRSCHYCDALSLLEIPAELLERARNSTLFGYLYRDVFEEDAAAVQGDEEPPHVHYALQLSEILVFASAAAISGVIGNVAYDILKATVKRILSGDLRIRGLSRPDRAATALIKNEEEVDRFLRYVQEYFTPLSGANAEIRIHVLEEVITYATVDVHVREFKKKKKDRLSREEQREIIKAGVERMLAGQAIDAEAAARVWTRVNQRLDQSDRRKTKRKRGGR